MDYKKAWEELRGYLEISKTEHWETSGSCDCRSNQEYFAGKEKKSEDTLIEMTRIEKEGEDV